MKKIFLLLFLSVQCGVFAQIAYTWNGTTSTAWNLNTNWTPNGIPGAADNVTVVAGANNCVLNANTQIGNLTVTSGVLDLGSAVLTPTGNLLFTSGTVSNGTLNVNAGVANTAVLLGTTLNANANLNVTTGAISINGGVYNGVVQLNQTGALQTTGLGGAVFNNTLLIVNSGTNHLRINGNCTFNGVTTFSNVGTGYLLPELTTGNTYNANLHLINNSPANLRIAYTGTTNINGNVFLSNVNTGNIEFCELAAASCNLLAGNTLSVSTLGFTQGRLNLRRFNQLGATVQNLLFTGTAFLNISNNCLFSGPLNATSPSYALSNSVYNSPVDFTKTGTTSDATTGGNVFNSTLTVNHLGSAYWSFGNGSADIYNDDVIANNNGSDRIIFGHTSSGNLFNGNIYVSQIGSSQGIALTWNVASTATLAATKSIFIGTGGFNVGWLYAQGITQLGTAPINLNFTGTSSMYLGPNSAFGGSVTITSPDIYARGAIYQSPVIFNKTGGTSNHNNGNQNIFNSTLEINNQSTGYFMVGYNSNDLFNDDVTLSSTNTGGISIGWGGGTGTPTLANGKTLLIGGAGYSAGYLQLGSFTQLGNAAINLNLTGTASFIVRNPAGNSVFGGSLTVTSPDIYIRGGTFNSPTVFNKTGGTSNHNEQVQNIFNSTLEINQQSSTGYFMLGYNANDQYNDDITVSSTGTGGIYLGWVNGVGNPVLASGKTIFVGSSGFSDGFLSLNNFTQLGNAPINLNFTGTNTHLTFANNSNIGGNVNINSPSVYFNGAVFNGLVNCEKTGAVNNACSGSNTFQAVSSFTNSGAGYLMFGNGNPDVFNDDVYFTNSGSNIIYPAYNSAGNLFNGNIEVNSTGTSVGIYFSPAAAATSTLMATKTISVGAAGYTSGYLYLRQFTQLGNAPVVLNLGATANYLRFGPSSAIGGNLTSVSPGLFFDSSVFGGTVSSEKNGASNDYSPGGNTFNGITSFTNSGAGFLLMGNSNPDVYNDDVSFSNTGSSIIYPSYNTAGNLYNGNIEVNSIGASTGINFSAGTAGTSTLMATKTISVGAMGFSSGYLILRQFTQLGNAPVNLNLGTTSNYLRFGPASTIGGDLTSNSPGLFFNGCTFNGAVNSIKNGATSDASTGGNVFNGVSSFTNSGSGYLIFANTTADVFNNDVSFTNSGSNVIYPAYNTPGNLFNGNIEVNSIGASTGIYFSGTAAGTSTLMATKTISVGAPGFSSGYLILRQFTQLGNAPVNLNLGTTSNYLRFGPASTIGGDLTSNSPGLFYNGCTFNGLVNSIKNGTTNDQSSGNNIFNAVSSFTNIGSGYLMFGNGNSDQFNAASNFNNLGSSSMYVAYNSTGNVFGGPVSLNNSPTSTNAWLYFGSYQVNNSTINGNLVITNNNGAGVYFGSNSGTSTLSAGNAISIGAGGFNAGQLIFRQFYQLGATAQSFTTTGTSRIQYGPTSQFDGDLTTQSPGLFYNSCTFNGLVNCEKNGPTSDASSGNNIFNAASSFTNSGSGYLMFGNGNSDQFNAASSFNNLGSNHVYVAYNSTGNVFGGPVTLNNSPTSTGSWIYFGSYQANNSVINGNVIVSNNNGAGVVFGNNSGTSILSAGNAISVGSGGFNSGQLIFRQFQQLGATAQNITTTGTSLIQFGPTSQFDGNVTAVSPGLLFNGCTFNGNVSATKNGVSNNSCVGNNIFNGSTNISNTSTGYLRMAVNNFDAYNNDVLFEQLGLGLLSPNYNTNCLYFGNVTVNSPATTMIFGPGGNGVATFTGTSNQAINIIGGSTEPTFSRVEINKATNDVTLNTRINISSLLTLTSGLIHTTGTNILHMYNNALTTIGNALSYVEGPMNYEMAFNGTRTLNFPIGKVADWRPAKIIVTHNNATSYTYNSEVFNASANALGWPYPATVNWVSLVHYWDINRLLTISGAPVPTTHLSGNQTVVLFYGANDGVTDPANLTVCKNTHTATTSWIDIGGTGATITTGSVASTSAPSSFNSFSRFTLGNKIAGSNPLPIELLSFTAERNKLAVDLKWVTATELNNDYFEIEKSTDGVVFDYLLTKRAHGSGNSNTIQNYEDVDLAPNTGLNYYRLKQIDKNGKYAYSSIISLYFENDKLSVYPNPFTDKLLINGKTNTVYSYKIINSLGQTIMQADNISGLQEVNTVELIKSTYVVELYYGAELERFKMIK